MTRPVVDDRGIAAALVLLVLLAAVSLLAGCSSLRGKSGGQADAASAAASSASAASAPASAADLAKFEAEAAYTIEIKAPDPLKGLLEQHLDVSRFRQTREAKEITRLELNRLVDAVPDQAKALLETEGYFSPQVQATIDQQTNATPGTPNVKPQVHVAVDPGPRVQIDSVEISFEGPVHDIGNASGPNSAAAQQTMKQVTDAWPLKAGEPFTQSAWSSAKNSALGKLRADGFPQATWRDTHAEIDPPTQKARLTLVAQSGPIVRLGELQIRGLERYNKPAVQNLTTFSPGTVYREELLNDYQERLQKAGLFESSSVELDLAHLKDGVAPVIVSVHELPLQQATTGIGISANTGPRLSLTHTHRRVFGWNATSKNTIQLGRDLSEWDGEIDSHPLEGQYRRVAAVNVQRLDTAGQILKSWRLRYGRSQDVERIERFNFVELISASTTTGPITDSAQAASLNTNLTWRRVDSVLLPTRGLMTATELSGGYAVSNNQDNGPYARALGRITAYVPLGNNWYSQFRIEAGQVFTRDSVGIPDPLLFRAGGDDSVRGYGYRTLAPTVDGVEQSARKLFTSSAEVARPISPKLPAVWWALFVDAGNAADTWSRIDPALGYGAGIRYRSPIGPLRIDLAYGQEVHAFRLHISVGIAM